MYLENLYYSIYPGEDSGVIEPPGNLDTVEHGDSITLSWNHTFGELVSHYKIRLEGDVIEDRVIQVNTTQITLPHTYSGGTLSAVSVCQQESDAISFSLQGWLD